MDPTLNGGPDSISWHSHASKKQPADPGAGLQDINVDPERGGKGPPPTPFEYHGWRKLIRNFTPS